MIKANSIIDFLEIFKTEQDCIDYLKNKRFADNVYCPHCGDCKTYSFSDGLTYKCSSCRKKFNIKTGTIFEGSKISLKKWFLAIYLLSSNKKGISSIQLSQQLGVTQKTAWFMDHRIRETYVQGKNLLNGKIEIDETYVGGKEKNKHLINKIEKAQGRSTKGKSAVVGMVARDGEVRATMVERVNKSTILKLMIRTIDLSNYHLIADEYNLYNRLAHSRVNHSQGNYVVGDAHTNSIESFWALFKRGYIGVYHYMSRKHMQRYINEFVTRLNCHKKEMSNCEKFEYFMDNIDGRLKYKDLIHA